MLKMVVHIDTTALYDDWMGLNIFTSINILCFVTFITVAFTERNSSLKYYILINWHILQKKYVTSSCDILREWHMKFCVESAF